jgi:hypothetical protein
MADMDRVVHDYEVSMDVAARRVHQFGCIKGDYAVLLVRSTGDGHRIDPAVLDRGCSVFLSVPKSVGTSLYGARHLCAKLQRLKTRLGLEVSPWENSL